MPWEGWVEFDGCAGTHDSCAEQRNLARIKLLDDFPIPPIQVEKQRTQAATAPA